MSKARQERLREARKDGLIEEDDEYYDEEPPYQ